MKKTKNYSYILLVCLFILVMGLMSACSSNSSTNTGDENSTTGNNTTNITITVGDVELNAVLFNNQTAQAFADMLPLTVELWHPAPNFARAFDLPERIPRFEEEPAGREYELGSLAYWYEGPSIAIIYNASREETVVPVVPIGKITSDVGIFFDYGDTITIKMRAPENSLITQGTQVYRNFVLDNVYHSKNDNDIHFNLYVPENYDGSKPYALYITLPGYEGLYFQGVGENLRREDFAFEAQKYNDEMIIVAPQLNDWSDTSANQTIALTEYLLSIYNIDDEKVFINGYSGGGETMSRVLGKRPELFTAALHVSSVWDGDLHPLVKSRTPIYMVIGEGDEYYGSASIANTYRSLYALYREEGLTEAEIAELLVLDIKDAGYFFSQGASNQHGSGGLVAYDESIMGWLFNQ